MKDVEDTDSAFTTSRSLGVSSKSSPFELWTLISPRKCRIWNLNNKFMTQFWCLIAFYLLKSWWWTPFFCSHWRGCSWYPCVCHPGVELEPGPLLYLHFWSTSEKLPRWHMRGVRRNKQSEIIVSRAPTFCSIFLYADISCVSREANAVVLHLLHVNHHHSLCRLGGTALVHSLHYQCSLSLGEILQWLSGLDLPRQWVNAEAFNRCGETVKDRAVCSKVLVLSFHGGEDPLGMPTGHFNDQRILDEDGSIVVDVEDGDCHL